MQDADRLVDEARAWVGAAPGQRQIARDPVNRPMIHHWCQAIGDRNPAYLDEQAAARTRHGGLIAPPGMLGTWTMDHVTRDDGGPRDQVLRRLEDAGYTSVVATDYEHEYRRQLRPGDRLSERLSVESMSDRKRTALGAGFFVTVRHDYLDQDDRPCGVGRMRLLKFRPRADDGQGRDQGPSVAERMRRRPRPPVNRDTRFFWDGVDKGELRIQQCGGCGTLRHPPSPMCGRCRSTETTWVTASGRGRVASYVVHHHPPLPGVRPPHTVLLVELEEGTRLVSELADGYDPHAVEIGMPVELTFAEVDDELILPVFRPADGAGRLPEPADPATPLAFAAVRPGQWLPPLSVEMSPSFIVTAALATRDFEEVHHDPALARARGSEDIFPNILTTNGLVLRLVTDWAGPEARVEAASIRLGVPAYVGERLELTGEVVRAVARGDEGELRVRVRGTVSTGDHVTGTVTLTLPREATA